MAELDEKLRTLQEKMARARKLGVQCENLQQQRAALQAEVNRLQSVMISEQNDVDRLEGGSLAGFFYGIVGKREEKLDQERQEAYAARVKYDGACAQLTAVESQLAACNAELAPLASCEQDYRALLHQKKEALKQSGSARGLEILRLEERLAFLRSEDKELVEALEAGQAAWETAEEVRASLNSAQTWGAVDLMGGGVFTDLMKYDKLDSAQRDVQRLQEQLRRFETELADVRTAARMEIEVDNFLRFADYFFDNLFTDWMVMDKISRSKGQLEETVRTLCTLAEQLQQRRSAVQTEQEEVRLRLEQLVCEA